MKKINFKFFFLIIQIFISVISPLLGMEVRPGRQQDARQDRTFLGLVAERCYSFEIPFINIKPIKYFDKKVYQQCNTDFFSPLQTIKNTLRYPINILKLLQIVKKDFIFQIPLNKHHPDVSKYHFLESAAIQKAVLLCVVSYFIYTKKAEWYEKLIKWWPWVFNRSWYVNNKFFVKDIVLYYFTVGQLVNILNNDLESKHEE